MSNSVCSEALSLARRWIWHGPDCGEHHGPMYACTCAWNVRCVEAAREIETYAIRREDRNAAAKAIGYEAGIEAPKVLVCSKCGQRCLTTFDGLGSCCYGGPR